VEFGSKDSHQLQSSISVFHGLETEAYTWKRHVSGSFGDEYREIMLLKTRLRYDKRLTLA
jgi:hypothetical protein